MTLNSGSNSGGNDSTVDTLSNMQRKHQKNKGPQNNVQLEQKANQVILDDFLKEMDKQDLAEKIAAAFPRHLRNDEDNGITRARMWANAVASMARVKIEISKCSIKSVTGALRLCAQLGLEPGPLGLIHLYPRFNTTFGEYELEMRVGYRGYLELIRRTGNVGDIDAVIVHEKDQFGLRKKSVVANGRLMYIWDLEHIPSLGGDPGKKVRVYATVNFLNSDAHIEVMEERDIDRVKNMTKTRDTKGKIVGPWVEHEDEMWRVAVVRRLKKWVQMSTEISLAETVDNLSDAGERQRLDSFAEGDMMSIMGNYREENAKLIESAFQSQYSDGERVIIED